MNTLYLKKLSVTLLMASLGFLSLSAIAGQDSNQRLMIEQTIKQQQQSKATEAARQHAAAIKAEECKKQTEHGKDAGGN
ncbi:hypothetical protein [Methylotenera mobilis]|jgi:hypothetical protein|uniref:hypothetical protein n=1 Tax=Methylotenera mobilis TaxID=359408 RepID=UPI00036D6D45|nr:hypothetical protein [Methylotenera mobilis]MDP3008169.1 hypothetical protein [Methylococcales bacterium]PPC93291.1 MAG: hypothetical protein CTY33_08745 [Methylotenera sp.]